MKVEIGKYRSWFGPYQIAEKLLFWMDKHNDKRVHKFGDFLAHGFVKKRSSLDGTRVFRDDRPETWLYKVCLWIDSFKKRKIKVRIDPWDSWSMDSTLSPIILPLLKQLKATKHGSGVVDLEDVPEYMRTTKSEEYEDQKAFEFYHEDTTTSGYDIHARYDWVLDEMIWAFEQLQPDCDWKDQYRSGNHDMVWKASGDKVDEDGDPLFWTMEKGPNDTFVCDYAAMQKHQDRISNGLRLFGKYFQTLWD